MASFTVVCRGRRDLVVRRVLEFTFGVWAREGGKSGQISDFSLDT